MMDMANVKYAGFGIRFLAFILDSIWMLIVLTGIMYLITGAVFSVSLQFSYLEFIFKLFVGVVLTVGFWFFKSATPGKMVLYLEVVDADTGGKVPTGRLLLRYLGYYLCLFPLGIGFLWICWDKRKQGWHDKMSNTVVVVTGP